jgi:hypothetical protein
MQVIRLRPLDFQFADVLLSPDIAQVNRQLAGAFSTLSPEDKQ